MSSNTFLAPSPVTPPFLLISNITNEVRATVTVTTSNNYVVGQLAHFDVPNSYGMFQISQLTGQILTVDPTNLIFTVDINTTQFDVFSAPIAPTAERPASLSSGGSRNLYNTLNVPFHSVNGQVGN